MKKLIILILGLLCFSGYLYAATTQYNSVGSIAISSATATGGIGLPPITAASVATLQPTTTGQMFWCNTCTTNGAQGTICISSGSDSGRIGALILSTGTHCQ